MKNPFIRIAGLLIILSLVLPACVAKPTTCQDPLGCVLIENKQPIKIAALLTLNGPDSPYGIDALRGVEIAAAEQKEIAGHPIEIVKVDDQCSAEGGASGAAQVVADPQVVGVIGTSCSSASVTAAKTVSEAGMVLVSPSSTAPSLTASASHQPGFFRTIYNDQAQAKSVAEFVYRVLGLRSMSTIDDKTPYSEELAAGACEDFQKLGGECIGRLHIDTGTDVYPQMFWFSKLKTQALYFPLYTVDGVNVVKQVAALGIPTALISSDGLLSRDFATQTQGINQGMYLSGPAPVAEDSQFVAKYRAAYNEDPIASYHLQAYDAAMMLFAAIQQSATAASSSSGSLLIGRQAIRDAILGVHGVPGLSGPITCSRNGDCASPSISIFKVQSSDFAAIYP